MNFLFFYLEAMYPTENVSCGKLDLSMGYADNLYRSYDFFFFFFEREPSRPESRIRLKIYNIFLLLSGK